MNKEKYVCPCACGRAFATAYPTTALCPACCEDRLWISYQPDTDQQEDSLFLAAGHLLSHPLNPHALNHWGARRSGQRPSALAVLVAVAILFAMGLALSGWQAEMQEWDR